jgi:HNH endonuclease
VLKEWETIHHIDGNPSNNLITNLFPCTEQEHKYAHKSA